MALERATNLKPKIELKVVRNHNYTVSLIDKNGKSLSFRDISGEDLEFLENSFNKDEKTQRNYLTFENIISLLDLLNVEGVNFQSYPKRICFAIFKEINEQILCNYMPKYDWLKNCYALQNGSFANLSAMEKVPMTKFTAMMQVHKEAVDSINNNNPE
jgi:hypothetical protein